MKYEDYTKYVDIMEKSLKSNVPIYEKIGVMNTRVENNNSNLFPVEVKESSIHGKGVFSTQKIYKGDIITHYPADAVAKRYRNGYKIYPKNKDFKVFDNWLNYCFDVEDIKIIGDPNKHTLSHCGHLINEAYPNADNLKTIPLSFKMLMEYYMRVSHNRNAKFISYKSNVAIIATKDIEPNTEITLSYGLEYWVNNFPVKFRLFVEETPLTEQQINLLKQYSSVD